MRGSQCQLRPRGRERKIYFSWCQGNLTFEFVITVRSEAIFISADRGKCINSGSSPVLGERWFRKLPGNEIRTCGRSSEPACLPRSRTGRRISSLRGDDV